MHVHSTRTASRVCLLRSMLIISKSVGIIYEIYDVETMKFTGAFEARSHHAVLLAAVGGRRVSVRAMLEALGQTSYEDAFEDALYQARPLDFCIDVHQHRAGHKKNHEHHRLCVGAGHVFPARPLPTEIKQPYGFYEIVLHDMFAYM